MSEYGCNNTQNKNEKKKKNIKVEMEIEGVIKRIRCTNSQICFVFVNDSWYNLIGDNRELVVGDYIYMICGIANENKNHEYIYNVIEWNAHKRII
jgi:hypothetical protein